MIKFMSFYTGSQTELNKTINKWLEENPGITVLPSHQQSFLEAWTSFKEYRTLRPMVYFVSFFYECPSPKSLQTDILEATIKLEEVRKFLVSSKHGSLPIEGKIKALGYSSLEDLEVHYSHLANATYSRVPELDRDIEALFTGWVLRGLEKNRFIKLGQLQILSLNEFKKLRVFGPKVVQKMKDQIVENHLEKHFPNLF